MSSPIQNLKNARRKRRRESYISMVIDGPAQSKTIFHLYYKNCHIQVMGNDQIIAISCKCKISGTQKK
jgi:hypothetical protein